MSLTQSSSPEPVLSVPPYPPCTRSSVRCECSPPISQYSLKTPIPCTNRIDLVVLSWLGFGFRALDLSTPHNSRQNITGRLFQSSSVLTDNLLFPSTSCICIFSLYSCQKHLHHPRRISSGKHHQVFFYVKGNIVFPL